MQWVGRAKLVAAVADAGALGFLTALAPPTPEALAAEIARTRAMTDKPFGVNLTILPSISPPPYPEYRAAIIASGVEAAETAGYRPREYVEDFKASGIDIPLVGKLTDRIIVEAETIVRHRLATLTG